MSSDLYISNKLIWSEIFVGSMLYISGHSVFYIYSFTKNLQVYPNERGTKIV